jgi:predicted RNase H-like HicB family nuclease
MAKIMTPLTAIYTKVRGGYTGWIEEIPGVNTQGKTLPETKQNLADALDLVIETNRIVAKQELRGKDVICEPFALVA